MDVFDEQRSRRGEGRSPLTRRDFLRAVLLLSGSAVIASCSGQAAELVDAGGWKTPTPDQLLPVATPEGEPPGGEELEDFLALSAMLTGVQNLDRDLGAAFLSALKSTSGFGAGLDELYRQAGFGSAQPPESLQDLESAGVFENEGTSSLAETITTAWYTGIVEGGQEPVVVTFVDSLALKTLHFTKPLTICGTFGFWAEKPAADPPPVRYWEPPPPEGEGDS
jgi:hypothetical protein